MNLRQLAPLCLVCCFLPSVTVRAQVEGEIAAPASLPVPPKYERVEDLPVASQEAMKDFGNRLQSMLAPSTDVDVNAYFDLSAMAEALYGTMAAPEDKLTAARKEFMERMPKELLGLVKAWQNNEVKFKGLVLHNGSPALRFRFANEISGISVQDLVLNEKSEGSPRIVDVYNLASGVRIVDQLRQLFLPSLQAELKGKEKSDMALMQDFFNVASRGKYDEAVTQYAALPQRLKDTNMIIGAYLNMMQQKGDYEAYKAAVREAAAKLKNGEFQLVLMNLYALEKDYGKAIECVDTFMQQVGPDAILMVLKAMLLRKKGDVPAAQKLVREALKMEPNSVYANASSLDVLLSAKDFPALRDTVLFLEKTGKYEFGRSVTSTQEWEEFKKSPEGARWRNLD